MNKGGVLTDYTIIGKTPMVLKTEGICSACGGFGPFEFRQVIEASLAKQWRLDGEKRRLMSARESMYCAFCGSSYRLRSLARAVMIEFFPGKPQYDLRQAVNEGMFNNVDVAEINSSGLLHQFLKDIPDLHYSEFGSKDPNIPDENLTKLTYMDNMFDLVLTSDTIEHVPDYRKSLEEIYRVLKPGGKHIFTVPIVFGRKTKKRVKQDKEKVRYLHPPSYHGAGQDDYLVWTEFGDDFPKIVEEVGFNVRILFLNYLFPEDSSCVFVATKPISEQDVDQKQRTHIQTLDDMDIPKQLTYPKEKTIIVKYSDELDPNKQAERINHLVTKMKLSNNHIHNIEDINDSYAAEINKLRNKITDQESMIKRQAETIDNLENSRLFSRVKRRLKSDKK